MRRLFVLVWLTGCHKLFSLDEIGDRDADPIRDGGGPIDPECPAIGSGPPVFGADLHVAIDRSCTTYTTSRAANLATAVCSDSGPPVLEEGPIDGALAPAQIAIVPSDEHVYEAWLAPEGDMLITHQRVMVSPVVHRIAAYTRTGSSWTYDRDIVAQADYVSAGVPSAKPQRRVVLTQVSGGVYRELVEEVGSWTQVRQETWTTSGPTWTGGNPSLSPDGLRMTFSAISKIHYTDRPTIEDSFGEYLQIDGLMSVSDPFITPDCERIYYSGAGTVFFRYLEQ